MIKNLLNSEGHQHRIIGSIITAILLKGWIFLLGGVASGRVCACNLCSRLAFLNWGEILIRSDEMIHFGKFKKILGKSF